MQIEQVTFPFSAPVIEPSAKKPKKKSAIDEEYEDEFNWGLGIGRLLLLTALVFVIVKVGFWVTEQLKQ